MIRNFLLLSTIHAGLLVASLALGQGPPDPSGNHHPDDTQENAAESGQGSGSKGASNSGGGMGGGGMGGMMEKMGAPKPKGMYPSLMELPNMTPEQAKEFQEEAHSRMLAGASLLSDGLDELSKATPTDDFATMQDATAKMREGLAQFESGLAGRRAIAEGKSPQNVALQWFKNEMNLLPPAATSPRGFSLFGMSFFHSLIMLALVAFATIMIWMYFFKMRRAAALLEGILPQTPVAGSDLVSPGPRIAVVDTAPPANATRSAASQLGSDGGEKSCCEESDQPSTDDCSVACGADEGEPGVDTGGMLPVAKRKLCRLRVAKIYEETEDVKTFRLVSCNGGPIPFSYLPGQFLTLTIPTSEKPIRRSYTIASAPTQGYHCEITVKREDRGVGSRYLHDSIKLGDTLEVQAPSGKFVFTGKEAGDIVLLAGGVGITPMMSIARALTDMGWRGEIYFVVACKDREHFIFEAELDRLQKWHSNLHVFAAMSQVEEATRQYRAGRLDKKMLLDWIPDISSKRVHICGPVPMMDAMKKLLIEMGVAPEKVHTENFGSQAKPKKEKPVPSVKNVTATGERSKTSLANVEFNASGKSTSIEPDESVLEAAERVDVDIDYSCRVGMCGICTIKLLSGEVTMEVDDGLDPDDKAAGKILACQAKCKGNIVVEA